MQNSTHFILCFYQTLKRYILLLLNSSVSYNLSWWTRYEWECPGYCQQLFVPCVSLEHITHLYPWEVLLLKIVPGLSRHIFFTESKFNSNATCLRNTRNYFINFICINHNTFFHEEKHQLLHLFFDNCFCQWYIYSLPAIDIICSKFSHICPSSPATTVLHHASSTQQTSQFSPFLTRHLNIQKYFDEVKAFPRGYLLGIAL